jgi:hypothetical protein
MRFAALYCYRLGCDALIYLSLVCNTVRSNVFHCHTIACLFIILHSAAFHYPLFSYPVFGLH